ncbi:histidine phosphatase family protein [Alteromonas oceanisediminis]|uniref:histidine phosphatase family protein n=1 Tax=Alteromonas oceanisediminis TaxID=2836180 RepID=UPI001BDAAC58|nr:histidine phosphatase family protein [Alteromonas oceanisediminis]MBT0587330.1 phosphoglycerate mutase family protein [Alteromonas oceanisediminis]
MTEIILVRHGQASFGKTNYDKLSELGAQQAHCLGQFWADNEFTFDALWRGDMVRHEETAHGILLGLSTSPEGKLVADGVNDVAVHSGLNEFDFQAVADAYLTIHPDDKPASGAEPAAFYRLLRKSMRAWSAGELSEHQLPETWQAFQSRVVEVLDQAVASGHKRIVMATSGGAIAMSISHILGADAASMINLNLQIRNTSLTHIFANASGRHLHQFNALPHLDNKAMRHAISYS